MSSAVVVTLRKFAAESRTFVFDFSQFPEVADEESIAGPVVPAVAGLTFGTPLVTVDDADWVPATEGVAVAIAGGTPGQSYPVECRVTTSGGATLVVRGTLAVD